MTDDLEDQVRDAFALQAASVPDHATTKVLAARYRPRKVGPRVRVAVGGGTAAAAVAAVVALTVGVVGPAVPSAFATWSPTPTPAGTDQVKDASAQCANAVLAMAQSADAASPPAPYITDASAWQTELTDVRNGFTLVVSSATSGPVTNRATCLTGTSWTVGPQMTLSTQDGQTVGGISGLASSTPGAHISGQSGGTAPDAPPPAVDAASSPSDSWISVSDDSVAVGDAGTQVTAVTLTLSNGTVVTTTVGDGYYAAWWPGNATVASATYTTAQGTFPVTHPDRAASGGA